MDGGSPVNDSGGADRVRAGERVHAVVAVRVLGARRPTARAQGRRRRRSHGGHRQAVHRQGDPEPAGSTATAVAAAAETGGGNGARRQVRREKPSAGVPAAAHPVHGRVPVHAVPDGFGRRLVLRQLQPDKRGTVRQQDVGVPRRGRRPPARGPDGPRGRRGARGRRRPTAARARCQMNVSRKHHHFTLPRTTAYSRYYHRQSFANGVVFFFFIFNHPIYCSIAFGLDNVVFTCMQYTLQTHARRAYLNVFILFRMNRSSSLDSRGHPGRHYR